MQATTVYTAGIWSVKPGKEKEFMEKWQKFARWSFDNVSGGRWASMLQDQGETTKFITFGPWESPEAIAAWRQTPQFKAAIAEFDDLCDDVRTGIMKKVVHLER